jgi:D-citramalate synthase
MATEKMLNIIESFNTNPEKESTSYGNEYRAAAG